MRKLLKYLNWFPFAVADLFVTTLAIFIVPFVVPFAKNEHLPKYFRWLETYGKKTGINDYASTSGK